MHDQSVMQISSTGVWLKTLPTNLASWSKAISQLLGASGYSDVRMVETVKVGDFTAVRTVDSEEEKGYTEVRDFSRNIQITYEMNGDVVSVKFFSDGEVHMSAVNMHNLVTNLLPQLESSLGTRFVQNDLEEKQFDELTWKELDDLEQTGLEENKFDHVTTWERLNDLQKSVSDRIKWSRDQYVPLGDRYEWFPHDLTNTSDFITNTNGHVPGKNRWHLKNYDLLTKWHEDGYPSLKVPQEDHFTDDDEEKGKLPALIDTGATTDLHRRATWMDKELTQLLSSTSRDKYSPEVAALYYGTLYDKMARWEKRRKSHELVSKTTMTDDVADDVVCPSNDEGDDNDKN